MNLDKETQRKFARANQILDDLAAVLEKHDLLLIAKAGREAPEIHVMDADGKNLVTILALCEGRRIYHPQLENL